MPPPRCGSIRCFGSRSKLLRAVVGPLLFTELPRSGLPGNSASGIKGFSETGVAPDLFLLLCYILALLPLRHTPPTNEEEEEEEEAGPSRSPPPRLCVYVCSRPTSQLLRRRPRRLWQRGL